jgi:preprotein translocase subunit SecG
MSTVLLIIQLIISIILTGLILIQRSEGGALGIGGGGGGGFMSGRSATTSIARMTGILGFVFILNCLALSVVFNIENQNKSLIDDANAVAPLTAPVDSADTTLPLADETLPAETPTEEAPSEATEEPQ